MPLSFGPVAQAQQASSYHEDWIAYGGCFFWWFRRRFVRFTVSVGFGLWRRRYLGNLRLYKTLSVFHVRLALSCSSSSHFKININIIFYNIVALCCIHSLTPIFLFFYVLLIHWRAHWVFQKDQKVMLCFVTFAGNRSITGTLRMLQRRRKYHTHEALQPRSAAVSISSIFLSSAPRTLV